MNNTLKILSFPAAALLAAVLASSPAVAAEPAQEATLEVLATVPAYAALAHEIGGPLVRVTTLCRSTQDIHGVTATPSLVERIRDADLLLYTGLDAEMWLDPMLRASGNLALLPGGARAVVMSDGVTLREVPAQVDRSQGDVHALGNPHVWTDPLALRVMAAHVRDALMAALPGQAAEIEARHAAFHRELTAHLISWLTRYAGLKGQPVVVHHRSWGYLLERFGLREVDALEPKPRVTPTASHLAEVVDEMRHDGVKVVIREPWQAPDAAEFVARETGARVVELSTHPEPCENGADLLAHFERTLGTLAQALGVEPAPAR
ncbi:MAG: zinc ABC transporter substrate-binding protein [Planctomycetes bacterium]|nr:zinc ABC transporter substrate-binding protein [Planctomycetota bacterium]